MTSATPTKTSEPGDDLLRVSLRIQACDWWPPVTLQSAAVFQCECSVVPSRTHVGQISGREADGRILLSPTPATSPLPHHTSLHHRHRRRRRRRNLSATALANVCHSTGPQLTSTCSKHLVHTAQATYTSAFFGLVMRIILLSCCWLEGQARRRRGTWLAVTTRRWYVATAADSIFRSSVDLCCIGE